MTAGGACFFEIMMQINNAIHKHLLVPEGMSQASNTYASLQLSSVVAAADTAFVFGLLWVLLQPGRSPFAFGGWFLGQLTYSSFWEVHA